MTDKEMKLERFKEENKNAVKGQWLGHYRV